MAIRLSTWLYKCYSRAEGLPFRGSRAIFAVFLAMQMVPKQVTLIPFYFLMARIGWVDSHLALIIPAILVNPFGVFLMRQFIASIPGELEEAAMIDGAGPYSSVSALPQLVIRARNIIITDAVSQVNAWLVADGYVSTCGAVPDGKAWLQGITSKTCDKQLRINGPVMAQSLYLRRTYGSQHASPAKNDNNHHLGTPAEIINIRPDTYLWGHARSGGRGSIKTTILRELPPRY